LFKKAAPASSGFHQPQLRTLLYSKIQRIFGLPFGKSMIIESNSERKNFFKEIILLISALLVAIFFSSLQKKFFHILRKKF